MQSSILLITSGNEVIEGKDYIENFYYPCAANIGSNANTFFLVPRDTDVVYFEKDFRKRYDYLIVTTKIMCDKIDGNLEITKKDLADYKSIVHDYHSHIFKANLRESSAKKYIHSDNAGLYLMSVYAEQQIRELTQKRKKAFIELHRKCYTGEGSVYCEKFYEHHPIYYNAEKNRRLFSEKEVKKLNTFKVNVDKFIEKKDHSNIVRAKLRACFDYLVHKFILKDGDEYFNILTTLSITSDGMVVGMHQGGVLHSLIEE